LLFCAFPCVSAQNVLKALFGKMFFVVVYEEVFRTTKTGYVPAGWELVTNLQSFTIGGPLPYGQQEKPKKKSFWERLFG